MYQERIALYREIEAARNSRLIVYVTGDRRGLETQIHPEVLDLFATHLDTFGTVPKISLFLYTRGGDTLGAWSIANLIQQYCDDFEVLIPAKAHSAGTLIAMGAQSIIMTRQATLGPFDPSVNTPLNPSIPGAPPQARMPVSVEAINGFIELARQTGIQDGADLIRVIEMLTTHVHPLVLGQVYRTRTQIRMLGKRLLARHLNDDNKIERILDFLCSESGSHDYTIYHGEAREYLGLNVTLPDENLYQSMKNVYNRIAQVLQLAEPYNPAVFLGQQEQTDYSFTRALIESATGGSHQFLSEGVLVKRQLVNEQNGVIQDTVQDSRTFEGWKYEPAHA